LQQGVFKYRIRRLQPPTPVGPTPMVGGNGRGKGGPPDIDYAGLGNGGGPKSGGGGLLGRLAKPVPPEPVKTPSRAAGPPPSARKKKKRSGRRR